MGIIRIQAVEIDPKAVAARVVDDRARLFSQQALRALASDFVPRDTGNLMSDVQVTPEGVEYLAPYARRVYYGEGMNFSREKNPLATARWDQAAMAARKDQLVAMIQGFFDGAQAL